MIHFKGFVIGLAILQPTTLAISLRGPSNSSTIGVQKANGMTNALTRYTAQISQNVPFTQRNVSCEVNTFDFCAVGNAVARLSAGSALANIEPGTASKTRQPVFTEKFVVDGHALLNGGEAEKVVEPPYSARVAFYADLAALHMDCDGG
ncbi:hypothetical protein D9M71_243070 [compost metagenome]